MLTPFYIAMRAGEGSSRSVWLRHATAATFAFAVWVYAMQGSLFTTEFHGRFYDAKAAALLIVGFTLISGCVRRAALPPPQGSARI